MDDVNVNVNNFLAVSNPDFDNSGEPGPQAGDDVKPVCMFLKTHDQLVCAVLGDVRDSGCVAVTHAKGWRSRRISERA